jgi:hypothetical protein
MEVTGVVADMTCHADERASQIFSRQKARPGIKRLAYPDHASGVVGDRKSAALS